MRRAARLVVVLGAIAAALAYATPAARGAAVGRDRVLAVLIARGPQRYSRASVETAFADAGAFLHRSSFGKLTLVPTLTPWLDGGSLRPDCSGSDRAFEPLRAIAAAAGYDPATFDSVFYVVDGVRCGFDGIEHDSDALLVTEPDARLIVHELGHTFGLPHAAANGICTWFCMTYEQGDPFSPMGAGFTDFNAYEKEQLGWIPRQERVTRPGNYSVAPPMAIGSRRHALVLDMPDGEYWLERRPGAGAPALIVHVVHPELTASWPIASATLLLGPIHRGHAAITRGQVFRVRGEFSVKVGRRLGTAIHVLVRLRATTR